MKRSRSIQGKLRRRIVLVGLASFFVATLLSNLVWVPMLRSRALKTAKNGNPHNNHTAGCCCSCTIRCLPPERFLPAFFSQHLFYILRF